VRRIGIDFGTTNSVVSVDGAPVDAGGEGPGASVVPSVLAFPPAGGTWVGVEAKRRRVIDAGNTVVSSKRLMGRHFHSYAVSRYREQYAIELRKDAHGGVVFHTRAGDLAPEDVAAAILDRLVARLPPDARAAAAVMTVPSEFDQAARAATAAVGKKIGFAEVELVDEPVATAYAYAGRGEPLPELVAVYDLGGGTFDLSIVDCSRRPFRVLGHGGDAYLGGDDLDHAIAAAVADEVLATRGWDLRSDAQVFDRLVVEAERMKIVLSEAPTARLELGPIDPAAGLAGEGVALDAEALRRTAGRLVGRTFSICDEVLGAAGVRTSEIGAVFLAGGSTRVRGLLGDVARYFGRAPRCEIDPMAVVAIGASSMPR
jgi:molecular chaperone DnaK